MPSATISPVSIRLPYGHLYRIGLSPWPLTPAPSLHLASHPGHYTDGITEAVNEDGEEFGEERLLHALLAQCNLSVSQLLQSIFDEVQRFSSGDQQDDITLVMARCLPNQDSLGMP